MLEPITARALTLRLCVVGLLFCFTGRPQTSSPNGSVIAGTEALHAAARAGNLSVISQLLSTGIDVDARDALGGTPLLDAAWSGNAGVITLLLSHGADVNATHREAGSTAL